MRRSPNTVCGTACLASSWGSSRSLGFCKAELTFDVEVEIHNPEPNRGRQSMSHQLSGGSWILSLRGPVYRYHHSGTTDATLEGRFLMNRRWAVGVTLEVGSSHISQKKNKDRPSVDHSLKATTQNSDRPWWLSPFDKRGRYGGSHFTRIHCWSLCSSLQDPGNFMFPN